MSSDLTYKQTNRQAKKTTLYIWKTNLMTKVRI